MGRLPCQVEGRPEDIGPAVVCLAQADNVAGVALNVAGGLVMHELLNRWPLVEPPCLLLIGIRHAQDRRFIKRLARDLQADWESAGGKTARH
jgi:hypothetical protein